MKPGDSRSICELWEAMHPYVHPESSGSLPYHKVLDLNGSFPLETSKGAEGPMDCKRARDSEAIETEELLSLWLLWRGIFIFMDNGTGSPDKC